ncbi:unnamed protein product [Spirodela intermedia]|uniref:Uncharacterized protein n=2 Tax=Spirodela intermedia TaxID=51605 RepID=A0A7I8KZ63_SPIIN|nr:unnamed protein product [Spirodela intermedia]CAA6666325.1 unnamed protein product [Spirodela intermedia]CAA7403103.1 unnamed protein product [Spirodela intermedia]
MNQVFKLFLQRFVLVFFDDILVYSTTEEEHCHHLRLVNLKKCIFGEERIMSLGHIISTDGVTMDVEKITVVTSWPSPMTLRELWGFLGLTGYYHRFIIGYGNLTWPLTQQLKCDAFHWSSDAEAAFQQLKE